MAFSCGVDGLCSALELARRAHVSRRSSDNRANKTRIVMNRLLRRPQLYSHTIAQPPCALRPTLQDSCGGCYYSPPCTTHADVAYTCASLLLAAPSYVGAPDRFCTTLSLWPQHGSASFICHGQGFSILQAVSLSPTKQKPRVTASVAGVACHCKPPPPCTACSPTAPPVLAASWAAWARPRSSEGIV